MGRDWRGRLFKLTTRRIYGSGIVVTVADLSNLQLQPSRTCAGTQIRTGFNPPYQCPNFKTCGGWVRSQGQYCVRCVRNPIAPDSSHAFLLMDICI